MKTLLVIDGDPANNWAAIFKGFPFDTPAGPQAIRVEQTAWDRFSIAEATSGGGCLVNIEPAEHAAVGTNQKTRRSRVRVDFVLVRNYPRTLHNGDYRNVLHALAYSGVSSVNSLQSIYLATERAMLYAALNGLKRKLGPEQFPFIDSMFVPNVSNEEFEGRAFSRSPVSYPCIVKVGSSCAGYGKIKVEDEGQMSDVRGILMMNKEYFTVEPFHPSQYDVRLQYITGGVHRAYKRTVQGDGWKRNVGNVTCVPLELTPLYRTILEAAAGLFGGLDIVTVDLLHLEDGSEVILEINDSASGFGDQHLDEDNRHVAQLVAGRIQDEFAAGYSVEDSAEARAAALVDESEAAMKRAPPPFLAALKKK